MFSFKKISLFFLMLFGFVLMGVSQSIEQRAREELNRRGLGEEEVRQRLAERGVDLNAIDITNPSEVFAVEQTVRDVIDELEREKAKSKVEGNSKKENTPSFLKNNAKKDTTDLPVSEEEAKVLAKEGESISEAIDDGATLEEAVSEELIEVGETELPPAKVYGQEIFRTQSIKLYRKSEDVKPPNSYVLGVGDIIGVSIWGSSEEDLIFEINQNGFVKPQGIPRIYLKGLTLGQVKEKLKSVFSNYYRFGNNQFEVTLNFGRTINVNIVGEVYNYGTFNIPAINTVFNALVAAGGPNDIGSVRNIKLIRVGVEPQNVDIYKFLQDPLEGLDLNLKENDIIQVPLAEKLIKISGAVIRPHVYELKEDEKLTDLLKYCGGLKINASLQNIQITRYENDELKIVDINLNELMNTNKDFELKNGDEVIVNAIRGGADNFVVLKGAIEIPGKYALTPNSRVSDVLKKITFKNDALLEKVILQRLNTDRKTYEYKQLNLTKILKDENTADNVVLQTKDELVIYYTGRYIDGASFSIGGHVREGGTFPFDLSQTLKIRDAIFMAGGLRKNATDFAYIERKDTNNLKQVQYIKVDLTGDDLDMEIEPDDKIVIYNQANFVEEKSISVSGAIKNGGIFKYDESLKIADLITMSGGLKKYATDFAYLERVNLNKPKQKEYYRIDLKSSDVEDFNLQPSDRIVFYSKLDFIEEQTISIVGAVKKEDTFRYDETLTIRDLITMAGGLKFNASRKRIDIFSINFSDEQKTSTSSKTIMIDENYEPINGDIKLQPFDKVFVRLAPEFELMKQVTIKGEVKYPGIYAILGDNEKLIDVIERAGGLTDEAFLKGIKLYRISGNETGFISMAIDEAVKNPNSEQNVLINENDEIIIPKKKDLVTIVGATKLYEVYDDQITRQNKLTVPYIKNKRAKYFINNYAGGIDDYGDKDRIYVFYPDGKIKKTKRILGIRFYPKVEKGSLIRVGAADPEVPQENLNKEKSDVDWNRTLATILSQATAIMTLILLATRISD